MSTIKEISELLGISAPTIRFYEKEGMVEIPRNERGIRQFDERSIDRLKAIVHYRRVGMPLEDIQKILAEFHNHALSSDLLKKTQASWRIRSRPCRRTMPIWSRKSRSISS
ncbi:TPA: MerR family transcriptional regulator [Streptococcus suis]